MGECGQPLGQLSVEENPARAALGCLSACDESISEKSIMIKYIYRDMVSTADYLPYGLALGVPIALILLWLVSRSGDERYKGFAPKIPVIIYAVYLAILLVITFFSRESGSRVGGMDLKLLSTWGINTRNNAFVVENVLLFIPYGFVCGLAFPWARNFFRCVWFGAMTSVMVELLQLITERGYFQIDDIMTNILGTMVGFLIYWVCLGWRRHRTEK